VGVFTKRNLQIQRADGNRRVDSASFRANQQEPYQGKIQGNSRGGGGRNNGGGRRVIVFVTVSFGQEQTHPLLPQSQHPKSPWKLLEDLEGHKNIAIWREEEEGG